MEAIAKAKYVKGSPRKARLVIDLVRGKNVSKALAILQFTNKRAAEPIAKCIRSAIANATYKAEQQNIAIDPDDLWIKTCYVDMGPTKNRRRLRPAPQGRAYFERRHYCHITVELTSDVPQEEEEEVTKKSSAKKKDTSSKKPKGKADTKKETKKTEKKAEENVEKDASKAEDKKTEKKSKADEKVAKDEKAEAKPEEKKAEVKTDKPEEKKETESAEAEKDSVATETPENKPLAAKTDEEKKETKKAADAQVEENEELEKQ